MNEVLYVVIGLFCGVAISYLFRRELRELDDKVSNLKLHPFGEVPPIDFDSDRSSSNLSSHVSYGNPFASRLSSLPSRFPTRPMSQIRPSWIDNDDGSGSDYSDDDDDEESGYGNENYPVMAANSYKSPFLSRATYINRVDYANRAANNDSISEQFPLMINAVRSFEFVNNPSRDSRDYTWYIDQSLVQKRINRANPFIDTVSSRSPSVYDTFDILGSPAIAVLDSDITDTYPVLLIENKDDKLVTHYRRVIGYNVTTNTVERVNFGGFIKMLVEDQEAASEKLNALITASKIINDDYKASVTSTEKVHQQTLIDLETDFEKQRNESVDQRRQADFTNDVSEGYVRRTIEGYETQFGMSSEAFEQAWNDDELEDTFEFNHWSIMIDTLREIHYNKNIKGGSKNDDARDSGINSSDTGSDSSSNIHSNGKEE